MEKPDPQISNAKEPALLLVTEALPGQLPEVLRPVIPKVAPPLTVNGSEFVEMPPPGVGLKTLTA